MKSFEHRTSNLFRHRFGFLGRRSLQLMVGASMLAGGVLASVGCGPDMPPIGGSGGNAPSSGGAFTGSGGGFTGSGGAVVGAGGGSGGQIGGGTGGIGPSSGGAGNTGGSGSGGGGGGGLDGYTIVQCGITTSLSEVAPQMQTVGTIEFTTDLAGADGGFIQFGKTTDYTLEAPVDWAATGHRTLLLGMTSNTEWHYRIVVTAGTNACLGPDTTLQTGGLPNGGPPAQVTPTAGGSSVAPAPGFIVTSGGLGSLGPWAFIVNHEGDVVWAYEFELGGGGFGAEGITRAKLSWDGKKMIARDLNVSGQSGAGNMFTVNLDGTGEEQVPLSTSHHDFTVVPEGVAYLAKAGSAQNCDAVHIVGEDGSNDTVLIDLWPTLEPFDDNGSMDVCHANAIRYYADDDTFTVSDRERDMLVKISGTGEVLWTIGASPASITGADIADWRVQHGHHLYDPDHLLVFSNGPLQGGTSHVLHFTLNGTSATDDWSYSAQEINTPTMGDVQKLPNGNVLITGSQNGTLRELDPNNMVIQTMDFGSLGYSHHRPTLYGEPPAR